MPVKTSEVGRFRATRSARLPTAGVPADDPAREVLDAVMLADVLNVTQRARRIGECEQNLRRAREGRNSPSVRKWVAWCLKWPELWRAFVDRMNRHE